MSENNDRNPLDDIEFTPDLIRGVKKDALESDNYPGNSEQVETGEKFEQVNQVLQVETTNYQELSQDISLLREKLEQVSQDIEGIFQMLREKSLLLFQSNYIALTKKFTAREIFVWLL